MELNNGIAPVLPSHDKTLFDKLPLPGGQTVADVKNIVPLFIRLGVPGVANDTGRARAAELYAAHLHAIGEHAAKRACDEWLETNKGA